MHSCMRIQAKASPRHIPRDLSQNSTRSSYISHMGKIRTIRSHMRNSVPMGSSGNSCWDCSHTPENCSVKISVRKVLPHQARSTRSSERSWIGSMRKVLPIVNAYPRNGEGPPECRCRPRKGLSWTWAANWKHSTEHQTNPNRY